MKILEAQSATLTNLEVHKFLSDQAQQYQAQRRRGPGNLETVRKELLQYLESAPAPLSQKPLPFDTTAIPILIQRLRPYQITKGELIMIMNQRPTNSCTLNAVLEDMEARFSEEEQEEIVGIVVDVLGEPPQPLMPPPAAVDDAVDVMQTAEG